MYIKSKTSKKKTQFCYFKRLRYDKVIVKGVEKLAKILFERGGENYQLVKHFPQTLHLVKFLF